MDDKKFKELIKLIFFSMVPKASEIEFLSDESQAAVINYLMAALGRATGSVADFFGQPRTTVVEAVQELQKEMEEACTTKTM